MLSKEERSKVKSGKCRRLFCSKNHAPKSTQCYCHIKRDYKVRHPVRYAYMVWRNNCKRRGKSFSVTFEEFCAFNKKTNYVEEKGIHAQNLSVDRIDNDKGYSKENIQALTVSENSIKFNKDYCPF